MAVQVPFLRVFISSPGDVPEERKIANEVIEALPYRPAFRDRIAFRIIAWDRPGADTPMLGSLTPQEAINRGLPKPSECDICLVIFWKRMGTPFIDADGTAYESGTHWELLDALKNPATTTLIYRRTEKVLFEYDDKDGQAQYERVIKFFESDVFYENGRIKRGVNSYGSPTEFKEKLATHIEDVVVHILSQLDTTRNPVVDQQLPISSNIITAERVDWPKGKSPFPGLRAFTKEDAPIFFGRDYETDGLVKHVAANRFVTVIGASGSGKSSLIGAGLIPRLEANAITGSKDWLFGQFSPGASHNPFEALAETLMNIVPALECKDPIDYPDRLERLTDSLQKSPDRLSKTLIHALKAEKEWVEVFLFINQLEELFTLSDENCIEPFAAMLSEAVQHDKIRVVATMRADFYDRAVPLFADLLGKGSFTLAAPQRDALRMMIERPAERAGLEMEMGLIERILDDTGREPGNLALMAFALDELYKLSEGEKITFADYEKLGGVQGAIGTRAEQTYTSLKGTDEEKAAWMQRVFYELVKVDERGTIARKPAPLDNISEEDMPFTDAFVEARLLVKDQDSIHVAHEALFHNWPRLTDWININLEFMREKDRLESLKQLAEADKITIRARLIGEYQKLFETMPDHLEVECRRLLDDLVDLSLARLLKELEEPETSPQRRKEIGDEMALFMKMMAEVGMTQRARPGVGINAEFNLPDIVFEPVEGSTVTLHDTDGRLHCQEIAPFEIARYPVTIWQYLCFLDAEDGSRNPEWWADVCPSQIRRQDNSWQSDRSNPIIAHRDSRSGNRPITGVSWFSARAFCNWLTAKYRQYFDLPEGYCVRIPTEFEWVFAALNPDLEQPFPWSQHEKNINVFRHPPANLKEAELNSAVAVGLFPLDRAANCNAVDMVGNVKEWCLNGYDAMHRTDLMDTEKAALRGGAFDVALKDIPSLRDYREGTYPRLRDQNIRNRIGFRVVVARTDPQIVHLP